MKDQQLRMDQELKHRIKECIIMTITSCFSIWEECTSQGLTRKALMKVLTPTQECMTQKATQIPFHHQVGANQQTTYLMLFPNKQLMKMSYLKIK